MKKTIIHRNVSDREKVRAKVQLIKEQWEWDGNKWIEYDSGNPFKYHPGNGPTDLWCGYHDLMANDPRWGTSHDCLIIDEEQVIGGGI